MTMVSSPEECTDNYALQYFNCVVYTVSENPIERSILLVSLNCNIHCCNIRNGIGVSLLDTFTN